MSISIKPNGNCCYCHGRGFISGDWVDYGSTTVQLPETYCECVIEQLPDHYKGDINVVYELDE
jgi:hypothetical protein